MRSYTLKDRCEFYVNAGLEREFPGSKPHVGADGRIRATWFGGQDCRGTGCHGSCPTSYLRRVMAMFPDAERVVCLFSGSLPPGNYIRVDVEEALKPEICCDAELLSAAWPLYFPGLQADLILADPPAHSSKDKIVRECADVLSSGGYLLWMDMVPPPYSKENWSLDGVIGFVSHRFKCVSMFRRLK